MRTLVDRLRSRVKGESPKEQKLAEAQSKIAEKNQRLKRFRGRMESKDREIEKLRAELARTSEDAGTAISPVESPPMFFIVGFAKSGTSWLTRIMDAHPEILCRGEGIFFGRGKDLGERRGLITPTSLYGALADTEYLRAWVERSIWTRKDDADRHLDNLAAMAIRYFLGDKLAASGKRIVGDKTPFVTEDCLREIRHIVPEAKVIHIIRDGRDIAVSAMHHLWNHLIDAGGHLDMVQSEELAKRDAYREDPRAFLASGESIFNEERLRNGFAKPWSNMPAKAVEEGAALLGENYTEVRYEDLLERPEEEVRRLLEYLGAEAGDETVRHCVESTSFERVTSRRRGEEESSAFLRKGVAGDWREVFTERDKEIFKEVAGDFLIRLGYEEDESW